jgi:hypothetical protein
MMVMRTTPMSVPAFTALRACSGIVSFGLGHG